VTGPAALPTGTCAGCGFDWAGDLATCRATVASGPEAYAALVALHLDDGVLGNPGPPDAPWSATEYLWHVVDVVRFGAERMWTLAFDPGFGVEPWDENRMAAARGYGRLSPAAGLRCLDGATRDWLDALAAVPDGRRTPHPEMGILTALDVARMNGHEVHHHRLDLQRLLT
jgi:hypothetical protein